MAKICKKFSKLQKKSFISFLRLYIAAKYGFIILSEKHRIIMNINIDFQEYNVWISKNNAEKRAQNRSNRKKCIFAKNWTLLYIHTKLRRIYAPYWLKKWYTAYFKLDIMILGFLRFFSDSTWVQKLVLWKLGKFTFYVFISNTSFTQSCYDIKYLNYFSAKIPIFILKNSEISLKTQ